MKYWNKIMVKITKFEEFMKEGNLPVKTSWMTEYVRGLN